MRSRVAHVLAVAAIALVVVPTPGARHAAQCTPAQKAAAQAKLAAFQKQAAKRRAAYFKTHKKPAQRKAYVKRQQATLKRLHAAAACQVITPPPPDTAAPKLSGAEASGAAVLLTFDEDLAGTAPAPAFAVRVDGLTWLVEGTSIDRRVVTVRLGLAVLAGEEVSITYVAPAADPLRDAAGNSVAGFTTRVTNVTPAGPPAPAEPGFAPSLAKPSFADDRVSVRQPWVGEWGPKTDPYWLPSTGTLRGLIIPVDFADAPATRTAEFYRDYLVPTSQRYFAEVSYGRLALELQTLPRWARMPRPASEYAAGWRSSEGLDQFFRDATALVDSEVDFSAVDAVYVIAPESLAGTLNLTLLRAWPGEGLVRDGRELRWAVLGGGGIDPRGPSSNLAAHHIVTHETGHFLGLPDLYDVVTRGTPDQFAWAGRWDLMADNRASAHVFSWHKWLLRWLDPTQLRGLTGPGSTEAELTPLARRGGLKAVVVPVSETVAYMIENRQRIGEDIELCDKGVLVWIVDSSRRNVERNAVVQPARRSYSDECGAIFDAGFDVGPNEVSVFEDANVRMEVLAASPNGNYRVRVTRK